MVGKDLKDKSDGSKLAFRGSYHWAAVHLLIHTNELETKLTDTSVLHSFVHKVLSQDKRILQTLLKGAVYHYIKSTRSTQGEEEGGQSEATCMFQSKYFSCRCA